MVQLIPGCPGSTAEFWGEKYWKFIKGKSIKQTEKSSYFKISEVAPQYFYDYCYFYEWIDKYDLIFQLEIPALDEFDFSETTLVSSSSMK